MNSHKLGRKPNKVIAILISLLLLMQSCGINDVAYPDLIAFKRGKWEYYGDIFIMNSDGTNAVRLESGLALHSCPEWSPSGRQFVFVAYIEGEGANNVYIFDLDTSKLKKVTNDGFWIREPAWSPDGKRIAMLAHPSDGSFSSGLESIYLIGTAGSNMHKVTHVPFYIIDFAWSPSGDEFLAITHLEPQIYPQVFTFTTMSSEGVFGASLLNDAIINAKQDTMLHDQIAWSPDGMRIAYNVGTLDKQWFYDIYVMNSDGTDIVNITNTQKTEWGSNPPWKSNPSWSPDSDKIVFASFDGNALESDIYVMDDDGTNIVRLTESGDNWCPAWQPSEQVIASDFDNHRSSVGGVTYIWDANSACVPEEYYVGDGIIRCDVVPTW